MTFIKSRLGRIIIIITAFVLLTAASLLIYYDIQTYAEEQRGKTEGYFAVSPQSSAISPRPCSKVTSDPMYIIKSYDGLVVISSSEGEILLSLCSSYNLLPETDRQYLESGIEIYNLNSLDSVICDYTG